MRWQGRYIGESPRLHEWHPWFAWYPVKTIDARWVWLERVEYTNWKSRLLSIEQHRQNCPANWHYRTNQ